MLEPSSTAWKAVPGRPQSSSTRSIHPVTHARCRAPRARVRDSSWKWLRTPFGCPGRVHDAELAAVVEGLQRGERRVQAEDAAGGQGEPGRDAEFGRSVG